MISHISTSDSDGGSAISAKRIHEKLLSKGYKSTLFVGDKKIVKDDICHLTNSPYLRKVDRFVDILLNKIGFQYSLIPSNFNYNKKIFNSSIIQLYNIHGGYFQLSRLIELSKLAKIIWRLSDYWSMTGHCAYPDKCENWKKICTNCPDLKTYPSIGIDNTKNIWKRKKRIIQTIDIDIVVPTIKLLGHVKESPILKDKRVHLIPNGVNTNFFKPYDKKIARSELNIPNKFSILFISHVAYNNYRKGTHILEKVMDKFRNNNNIQFLIAGIHSSKWTNRGYKNLITFDYNNNLEWKKKLYNSSDLIMIPSINENLPNVLLESMSCGVPSISNSSGGVNECVNKENGILVENSDIKGFTDNISKLFRDKLALKRLKENSRKTILKKYSETKEVNSYIKLYEDVKNRT